MAVEILLIIFSTLMFLSLESLTPKNAFIPLVSVCSKIESIASVVKTGL